MGVPHDRTLTTATNSQLAATVSSGGNNWTTPCLDRAKCINIGGGGVLYEDHFIYFGTVGTTRSWEKLAATGLPLSGSTEDVGPGLKAFSHNMSRQEKPVQLLPFDMSFADSCRTSSGILSHWHSERHRSISVSSREPDFLAVILASGLDPTKTPQQEPSRWETAPSQLAW